MNKLLTNTIKISSRYACEIFSFEGKGNIKGKPLGCPLKEN